MAQVALSLLRRQVCARNVTAQLRFTRQAIPVAPRWSLSTLCLGQETPVQLARPMLLNPALSAPVCITSIGNLDVFSSTLWLSSVLKKRKKAMNKHKLKKLRKNGKYSTKKN